MLQNLDFTRFNDLRKILPVLDTRSEAEYAAGHIPGSFNLPLFDDEERKVVGTMYKQSGKDEAVLQGLDFAGKKLSFYVKQAMQIAPQRNVLMHCWRGGMRSSSLGWLLSLAGFEVHLLLGGYKAYRQFIRKEWLKDQEIIILAGKTGTGKTEILHHLQRSDQQIIDLEHFAHHKGSAFGSLGEMQQPTIEQFENDVADAWSVISASKPVWLEDESKAIGKVFIPDNLHQRMKKARVICLDVPKKLRIERLTKEYTGYPKEMLIQSILKIHRRLGGQNAKLAISAVEQDDFATAIHIVLHYYDKAYEYDLTLKVQDRLHLLPVSTADAGENAAEVLSFCRKNQLIPS